MRLIDVDEFKEINDNKIKMYRAGGDYTEDAINLAAAVNGMAVRLLEVTPTVDAVPIIRCKDCKFAKFYEDDMAQISCKYSSFGNGVEGYCNYAEPREA